MCNLYLCAQTVTGFLPLWVHDLDGMMKEAEVSGWLFIARVFGKEISEKLALDLLQNMKLDFSGKMLNEKGVEIKDPIPEGIIENIRSIRLTIFQSLLNVVYSAMDVISSRSLANGIAQCYHNGDACDVMAYGAMCLAMQKEGLWPRKKPSEILMSIKDLKIMLDRAEDHVWSCSNKVKDKSHTSCH
ncbi:hypothetical protein G7Y89_g4143 [Cudoniella acicularis]|uniref:Uncharacterized protein n=1 Tax=Cudoniella acicularis TaxID=354080 RepID=A0A8H4RRF0_9HELO|nr:hypothetical protein G7Y89_g4143 [Cudoniella acicularis]